MSKPLYKKFTAPGLPPWPPLYLHAANRDAFVSVRHANWRTYKRARLACQVLNMLVTCPIVYVCFLNLMRIQGVAFIATLFVPGIISWVVLGWMLPIIFESFLARRIFGVKTVIKFSAQAIVIYGRLYERPVVIWRQHLNKPVIVRFSAGKDTGAKPRSAPKTNAEVEHNRLCEDAQVIQVIISRSRMPQMIDAMSLETVQRSLVVCEVTGDAAPCFTMVLGMAAALTERRAHPTSRQRRGVDLDMQNLLPGIQ